MNKLITTSRYTRLVTDTKTINKNLKKKTYFPCIRGEYNCGAIYPRMGRGTLMAIPSISGGEQVIKSCDISIVWKCIHFLAATAVMEV